MEVEVKEALRTLTEGNAQMNAHEVLGLQDRLRLVDEKFILLRREITRLNANLAEEKDKNGVLEAKLSMLLRESMELKTKPQPSASAAPKISKKTKKKK